MGVYSGDNMFINNTILTDTLDSVYEDVNVEPLGNSNNLVEVGFEAIQTVHENYQTIMKRIGISELNALETTGEEMIYTEGVLSSIYNAVKNFFMKVWEKIKSLFKRFMMIIDSYTKNDKDFLNKYRKDILAAKSLSDFTFKGYKFTLDSVNTITGLQSCKTSGVARYGAQAKNAGEINDSGLRSDTTDSKTMDKTIENIDDNFEKERAEILKKMGVSGSGSYTLEEFKKELREAYRNKESEKQELDNKDINVHTIISELAGSKDTKKKVDDAFKENKKIIEQEIKDLDRLQRDWVKDQPIENKTGTPAQKADKALKNENAGKNYTKYLKLAHLYKDCMIAINAVFLEALKDRSRQNKAIAIKIVAYKPKKEEYYNESYNGSYIGESFLSNIELK